MSSINVVPPAPTAGPSRAVYPSAGERGFTLMELMAVVCIIGILSVAAIPTMNVARMDRHVYDDAASIADLVREARSHAMGRGAAVLLHIAADGNSGKFYADYSEAVGPNPGAVATPAADNRIPMGSCKAPTRWVAGPTTPSNARLVRFINWDFASSYELKNEISATMKLATAATTPEVYFCFTPSGRTFFVSGTIPNFDALNPMTGSLEIAVQRKEGSTTVGLVRTIIIPPTGVTRITSAPAP